MSNLQNVDEPTDNMEGVNDTDEHGLYPGEFEYNRDQMIRQSELAQFTSQELQDEIYRRLFEPFNTSLKQMSILIDKINGVTPERPF